MTRLVTLGVLAFALAHSSLSAATVTQDTVLVDSDVFAGSGTHRMRQTWAIEPFDPTAGVLSSVVLSLSFLGEAGVYDANVQSPDPVTLIPSFNYWMDLWFFNPPMSFDIKDQFSQSTAGPGAEVPNHAFYGVAGSISGDDSFTLTDSAALSLFESPGATINLDHSLFGTTWAGGANISANSRASLVYHYTPVTDEGSTLALLVLATFGILAVRRRVLA